MKIVSDPNNADESSSDADDGPFNHFEGNLTRRRAKKPRFRYFNWTQISPPVSEFVNLDTTALIALTSESSNGAARMISEMSVEELKMRFHNTWQFMLEQAQSELEKPLLPEIHSFMEGKKVIICEFVHSEFSSIVKFSAGPNEKNRATNLLSSIKVVPNNPTKKFSTLPETGRIKERHKITFGTGDYYNAPTISANLSFVRAASQTGLVVNVIEHRPRALTGD